MAIDSGMDSGIELAGGPVKSSSSKSMIFLPVRRDLPLRAGGDGGAIEACVGSTGAEL